MDASYFSKLEVTSNLIKLMIKII